MKVVRRNGIGERERSIYNCIQLYSKRRALNATVPDVRIGDLRQVIDC